jgi:hypothetical protein
MFQSKARPIIVPQHEHARLSGVLAAIWGNKQFDLPALPYLSFIKGVTFHDRGYGHFDNSPIGGISETEWLEQQRKGIEQTLNDPVADILALYHIRRLLSSEQSETRDRLIAQAEATIVERLGQCENPRTAFDFADKITHFCDSIAFGVAFEDPGTITRTVFTKQNSTKQTTVSIMLAKGGHIIVDPWPFNVPQHSGFMLGYEAEHYPDTLIPVVVPWSVVAKK